MVGDKIAHLIIRLTLSTLHSIFDQVQLGAFCTSHGPGVFVAAPELARSLGRTGDVSGKTACKVYRGDTPKDLRKQTSSRSRAPVKPTSIPDDWEDDEDEEPENEEDNRRIWDDACV